MHKGVKQGVNPLKWVQIWAKRVQESMKKAREIGLFSMVAAIGFEPMTGRVWIIAQSNLQ